MTAFEYLFNINRTISQQEKHEVIQRQQTVSAKRSKIKEMFLNPNQNICLFSGEDITYNFCQLPLMHLIYMP